MSYGEFVYVTPEEAVKKNIIEGTTLEEYQRLAAVEGECDVCGQPVWKLLNNDMCFSCTTGEADCSDDYEIV